MQFKKVCLEAISHTIPEEIVTSAELEEKLKPLYERLRLPPGRLELMSGIRERRYFPPGTQPGDISILTTQKAIEKSGVDPSLFGACLHGSVCRDFFEPATACRVHHAARLPSDCVVQDVSNACLGVLSGAVQIATMIELGQIKAGVVVGTETSRQLMENTVEKLNNDYSLTRNSVKNSVASMTIGSASAAMVLCHRDISKTNNSLIAATTHAETKHHELCQSEGLTQVMNTDSEQLMHAGIAAGVENFSKLLKETGWSREEINRTFCHQVGSAHRKMMLESLGLDSANDHTTLEWLGNTGSAALPTTLSDGMDRGIVKQGDRVALLGIGSGVNCLMMGIEWRG